MQGISSNSEMQGSLASCGFTRDRRTLEGDAENPEEGAGRESGSFQLPPGSSEAKEKPCSGRRDLSLCPAPWREARKAGQNEGADVLGENAGHPNVGAEAELTCCPVLAQPWNWPFLKEL